MQGRLVVVVAVLVFVLVLLPTARWCGYSPGEVASILTAVTALVSGLIMTVAKMASSARQATQN
jgi:hypothetical protein